MGVAAAAGTSAGESSPFCSSMEAHQAKCVLKDTVQLSECTFKGTCEQSAAAAAASASLRNRFLPAELALDPSVLALTLDFRREKRPIVCWAAPRCCDARWELPADFRFQEHARGLDPQMAPRGIRAMGRFARRL